MIAEYLRKAVLQAALQGKLTSQLSSDGNANDLLFEIKKEKDRLINEGIIKKEKSLSNDILEDEISLEIPENWAWAKIGQLAFRITDGEHSTPKRILNYEGYYLLSARNVLDGSIQLSDVDFVCEDEYIKISRRCSPCKGDVLISCSGSIGRVAVVDDDNKYVMVRSAAMVKPIRISSHYLMYALQSPYVQVQIEDKKKQTAQANLFIGEIKNLVIPIPPLNEQNRIVGQIVILFAEIDKLKKDEIKLDSLQKAFPKKMKDAILHYAVQGKLTEQFPDDGDASDLIKDIHKEKSNLFKAGKIPKENPSPKITEVEKPFDIPDNWCWARLNDLCEYLQRGKSPKYSPVKKYPVVAQKCNQWEGFSIDKAQFIDPETVKNYSEERILKDNDLMWNSTGLGTLGRIAMYEESKNPYGFAVADSHVTVIRPLKSYVHPRYIYAYISGPYIQSIVEDISSGSTKQKELATKTIKNLILPLPPYSEQVRIVDKLEMLLPICSTLE